MEIRIGIVNAPRELSFDSSLATAEVVQTIESALTDKAPFVQFSDDKGSTFLIPTVGIAYVHIGAEETRRVGFVA